MPLVTLTPFNAAVPETLTYYSYTSSLSPIAYWRLGDVPRDNIDDDFTGIDGSPPNPTLWTITNGTLTLNANTLRSVDPTLSTSNIAVTKFKVAGDFDAQVDYNIVALDQSDAGTFNGIWIKVTADNTSNTGVLLYRWNNDVNGESSGYENYVDGVRLNTWTDNAVSNTNTSGVFSIVRTGSLITASVNGHVWSSIAFSSQNSTVEMHTRRESVSVVNFDVNFDNFVLNSGTIINPVATEDNNLYDGTYVNDPALNSPSLLQIETDNPSVTFDGIDQIMTVPDNSVFSLNTTGTFAVSFLFRSNDVTEFQGLVAKSRTSNREWTIYLNAGILNVLMANSGGTIIIRREQSNIISNIIYHVVVNFTGVTDTDEIEIYINSTQRNALLSSKAGVYSNTTSTLDVGGYQFSEYKTLNGEIDEVALFDHELSSAEISQMFALTGIGTYFEYMMSLSPIAYWRLGETSGTLATDSVGTYDGTYVNTPTLETPSLLIGDANPAVTFTAAQSEYVNTNNDFDLVTRETSVYSISLLFNVDTLQAMGIISNAATTADVGFAVSLTNVVSSEWRINFQQYYGTLSNYVYFFENSTIIAANTTYHLVLTVNGADGAVLYINNVSNSDTIQNPLSTIATTRQLNFGRYNHSTPGGYVNGVMDEVAIYDKVLTPTEITNMYQKSIGN